MNIANDLFLLMFNLSQLHNKDKIIELFVEGMSEVFKPVALYYNQRSEKGDWFECEIRTRNSQFGIISIEQYELISKENEVLINNAVQMLAVILERLEFEIKLQQDKQSLKQIVDERYIELQSTVHDLQQARSASINLIADLTAEIEKRTKYEKELEESEEKFRTLFRNHAAVKLILDNDGCIIDANEAAARFYGWSIEELKQLNMSQINILPADEVSMESEKARNVENFHFEFKHRKADGNVVDVEVFSSKVVIGGKNLLHSIIHDISDKKEAEKALKNNYYLLKIAGETAKFGGWSVDLATNQCTWSDVVAAIHEESPGFSPPVSKGISYYAPEWHQKITEVFTKCANEGISYDEEMEIISSGGNKVWVRTIGEAVKDEMGKIVKVQGSFQDITERKQAEIKLRESEEIFRYFMENSPIYVFFKDKDIRPIRLSKNYEQMLGKPLNELLGKNMDELFPSDLAKKMIADDKKILNEGNPFVIEEEFNNRFYNTIKFPITIDGEPRFLAGYTIDITERRKAEDALRASEKSYKELIDGMNETVWVIDFNGKLIDVNNAAIRVLGYTKDELLSIGLHSIDSSMEVEKIENLTQLKPEDEILIFETSHRTKNGKIIPVEVYSSNVNYQGIKAILIIARDITQRKRDENIQQILYEIARTSSGTKAIEDLLVIVREELSKVLDTTNFYVALYNPQTETLQRVIFVNEKFDLVEWSIENSLSGWVIQSGKTLLLNDEERAQFAFQHHLELTGVPAKCWLGVPLMDDKKAIGIMVVQSYTDARAYDNRSARLLEMIAHELAIVFQRKNMIQDLIKAKEKAEESDRLKSAFLANVSHEIRTPMNGILGFLELLKKPNLQDDQKEKFIEVVNISGQRLLVTINDIVEISKIESGQVDVYYSNVNIKEVMEYYATFFRQQAIAKGLSLTIQDNFGYKNEPIQTDKNKLDGILTNLINNAIKFTKVGSVEFGNYLDSDSLVFYVKDTGSGIPANKLDIIFERFVQADQSMSRPYEGSGLGLSIVKAYIDKLNGKIWVNSEVGLGSTFFFSIPYIQVVNKTDVIDSMEIVDGEVQCIPKILIAEDDEVCYYYLETLFQNKAITLLHAMNGLEAIKAVQDNPDVSLVLMDIRMPEMDGLEATRKIREFNKTIPIIAQTAHALAGDIEKTINAGCNDYISKPIKSFKLFELINKYISNGKIA